MPAQTVIQIRRDTAANWESVDPILASGEIGFDTTNNQIKIGNGTDEWTVLEYASGSGGASVQVSATAPEDPEEGNVWFNSSEGNSYIYYDGFWVPISPAIVGPAGEPGPAGEDGKYFVSVTAPSSPDEGDAWFNSETGRFYVYYDGYWVENTSSLVGPQGEPGPPGDPTLVINSQVDTYTIELTDSSKLIQMSNSGGINLNVPTDASVDFPVGTQINILQSGAGQVTIQAVDGITTTINSASGLKLRTQWSIATLVKRGVNLWVATGDLAE
jgi:hypothetical protein